MPITTRSRALIRRLSRLLSGLVICGLGLSMMIAADLGLGPWDVLHQGLARITGAPIGVMVIAVGFAVLLLWIPLKERPGVGTIANVVVIGVVIDLVLLVVDTPGSLLVRSLMMLSGPVLFAIGSGFYLGVRMGPGPRDGVMTGLAKRGMPVGVVRGALEVSVLVLGWALGGTVGAGTIWFALGIGPMVHWCLPRLAMRSDDVAPGVRSAR